MRARAVGKPESAGRSEAGWDDTAPIDGRARRARGAKHAGTGRKGLRPFFLHGCGAPSHRPPHPGEFLRTRYMVPSGLNQQRLAQELGISRRRINELVKGRRGITPDTAIRLAAYFGMDAGFWMALQNAWDMHLAWKGLASSRRDAGAT